MQPLKFILPSALFFVAAAVGCNIENPKEKANEVCGADEKAKTEGDACKSCCEENGVKSYMFDGMNNTCTCG